MRFFSYNGTDGYGRPAQGTIQAASADEARRLLAGGGVQTVQMQELGAPASVSAPISVPAPVQRVAPTPVVNPVARPVTQPVLKTAPAPAAAAPAVTAGLKYRFAGNKTSFFFFDALGRFLQSGIAANRALEELGQRSNKPWLSERLLQASVSVGKGMSLADALEAMQAFPTGAVGTIRAGEASGALPAACVEAAHGCEQAHKLGSRCAAMMIMFVVVALYLPFGTATVAGSLNAIAAQDAAGGTLPVAGTATSKIGAELRHTLPIAIVWYIAVFSAWRFWLTHRMQRARHRMVLITPILSGRAREESLARSAWALTELSRAGFAPNRAMMLAADACPNLIIADRFRDEALRMREQTKLSVALSQTGLLDPQLINVVENGELAGDVPGAVASVHNATATEFERKNSTAHTRIWFVLYPILGIIVGVIVATFMKQLWMGEFRIILGDS